MSFTQNVTVFHVLPHLEEMAFKGFVSVLIFSFLGSTSAPRYCASSINCQGYLETCCSDGVCREACNHCSYDSQCGTGECCDSNGICKTSCYNTDNTYNGGTIGGIVGSLVFFGIVCAVVACCFCSCCPYYRHRNRGRVIQVQRHDQPVVVATMTAQRTMHFQQPLPVGYHPPATGAYGQPPPPYTAYPQLQAGPYPSAQSVPTINEQPVKQEVALNPQ